MHHSRATAKRLKHGQVSVEEGLPSLFTDDYLFKLRTLGSAGVKLNILVDSIVFHALLSAQKMQQLQQQFFEIKLYTT